MIKLSCHIRWTIRRDLPAVLAIESSTQDPWTEEQFLTALRQRHCIGMVAEHGNEIVGHMLYELHPHHTEVIRFVVHPQWKRRGIGGAMLDLLKSKLSLNFRTRVLFPVPENQLDMQLFLRAQGLHFSHIAHSDAGDCYVLEYGIQEPEASNQVPEDIFEPDYQYHPVNRLAHLLDHEE